MYTLFKSIIKHPQSQKVKIKIRFFFDREFRFDPQNNSLKVSANSVEKSGYGYEWVKNNFLQFFRFMHKMSKSF